MNDYAAASPIRAFAHCVADSVVRIAPEREAETLALLAEHHIVFKLDDRDGFRFAAGKPEGEVRTIRASVQGLELLWAVSYASWILYTAAKEAQANGAFELVFASTPKTAVAVALLRWAVRNIVLKERTTWPVGLPTPLDCRGEVFDDSDEAVASSIGFAATGWILHHEIAHVYLQHPLITAHSEQEEQEADDSGTAYVLDRVPEGQRLFRGLGIVVAILSLAITELYAIDPAHAGVPRTHPRLAQRISRSLLHEGFGDDHQVFHIAVFLLKLHFDTIAVDMPRDTYETARACFEAYCFSIHRDTTF